MKTKRSRSKGRKEECFTSKKGDTQKRRWRKTDKET